MCDRQDLSRICLLPNDNRDWLQHPCDPQSLDKGYILTICSLWSVYVDELYGLLLLSGQDVDIYLYFAEDFKIPGDKK